MFTPNVGYPVTSDPNVARVFEETLALCHDIDSRVQALRLGIAQAVPSLAPHVLSSIRSPIATPFGLGSPLNFGFVNPYSPLGQFAPSPYVGIPSGVPSAWPNMTPLPTLGLGFRGF